MTVKSIVLPAKMLMVTAMMVLRAMVILRMLDHAHGLHDGSSNGGGDGSADVTVVVDNDHDDLNEAMSTV